MGWVFIINPGSLLLSQRIAPLVPSPVEGLTSVFGMGTGVAPLLWPPESDARGRAILRLTCKFQSALRKIISNFKLEIRNDLTG